MENSTNIGTIRQIFDGIAVISGLKCAYGELVQFPKADQQVNIFGLVVSINKFNYSKVILFGSTFLLKVGDQVDNTFNNLKVYIGSQFLGTVLNGIGQYIDIKEMKFVKNVWASHYQTQVFKSIFDSEKETYNTPLSLIIRKRLDWTINTYYNFVTIPAWLGKTKEQKEIIQAISSTSENAEENTTSNTFSTLKNSYLEANTGLENEQYPFLNADLQAVLAIEDGKGASSDVEIKAPHIMDRSVIDRAIITGLKVVDCLFPIGKGQRQLILGDKQSGKTTIGYLIMITQAKINPYYSII